MNLKETLNLPKTSFPMHAELVKRIIFAIMSYFPKNIIIGNYDDVEYFGSYNIYLNNLGLF